MTNQNPEQIARDNIDRQLISCGWVIQDKNRINLGVGAGVAVREYQTDIGPADYILFVDRKPVGVIEAKREEEGARLTTHEDQAEGYAVSKLKHINNDPLSFAYESTGEITRFTNFRDPKPRSRSVFTFHKPETLRELLKGDKTLRKGLLDIPSLPEEGLRECQIKAINNLEQSFKENRPRALIQMATGSGKTFTAITFIYRLLKYAGAKRILFLVDTRNLGEQAEQEFMAFQPNDDNRKFAELYGVYRLKSSAIPTDNQVYISTIQRLYSILKGEELDEAAEEENPNERRWQPKEPVPVVYNERLPPEFFDFVVIDECHRSIYNLWKQVLDYFDSFQIGLTATPDNRTFGYFNQNVVSDYGFEEAVTDGVLVPYNVFIIETQISRRGGVVWKGEYVVHREKLTRRKRWDQMDEDMEYSAKQLDDAVVNPNQIRLIIKTFRDHLPEIFPDRYDRDGRFEIPKTLIFAKSDSHADDIINIVREEFAEENKFCKKVTPSAGYVKDHFVIVDAIGVTKSLKTDSRPLEKKPGVPLKDLLGAVAVGARDEDLFTSLANRLTRLERQLTENEKILFAEKANGRTLKQTVKELLNAYNPDTIEDLRLQSYEENKNASSFEIEEAFSRSHNALIDKAAEVFTGDLNTFIENVRKAHEQIIDHINRDNLVNIGWDKDNTIRATELVNDFTAWLETHRDEITALQIFYNQPYRRRELTFNMIKEVLERLKADKPALAPLRVWNAYEQIEKANGSPKNELIALVSLIRRVMNIDELLTPYDKTVDKNFQNWVFQKQAGALKFTEEQMQWLRMIKDYVAGSFHIERDDFELSPFNAHGGLGKMWQLFGDETDEIINELNEALAA